jgi:ribosomal protein S18 acetylase RimI-like enzyme
VHIELASRADLAAVREAYDHARAMQREQASAVWPEFADASILHEIEADRLFRVIDGDALVGVFSVAYEDAAIWGEHERGAHIYLHRIARALHDPGRGLMAAILSWAFQHCAERGREGLRMDTWASNDGLIDFYKRLGFRLIGKRRLGADSRLPPHYHGNEFALLERTCGA